MITEFVSGVWRWNRNPGYCVVPAIERMKDGSNIHHVALYNPEDCIFFFNKGGPSFFGFDYPCSGDNLCLENEDDLSNILSGIKAHPYLNDIIKNYSKLENDLRDIGDFERILRRSIGEYREVRRTNRRSA